MSNGGLGRLVWLEVGIEGRRGVHGLMYLVSFVEYGDLKKWSEWLALKASEIVQNLEL